MAFSLSSPVTGGAQTGFTSPTYTVTADQAPNNNSKQYAITALGGTQANVDVHSVSKPFTTTLFRPAQFKVLPPANPLTGLVKRLDLVNVWRLLTRKGAQPLANNPNSLLKIYTVFEIPAGVDTYEPEEVRAALSAHIGVLNQTSAALGDSLITGII